MRKVCLFILIITFSRAAIAQFNDTLHYHATFSSTGSINRTEDGNSYLLNNSFGFGVKKKENLTLNLTSSFVYGKQNDDLTNRDFTTSFTANLFKYIPFKHSFYWALVNYNSSFSLKINDQTQVGAGLAYSVIDKKNVYLNFSDGVLYDQSNLMLKDTVHDIYNTYRNSFRLQFHFLIKDILVIDGTNFLQNSFQWGSDYIIHSNTSLTLKIKKWIGLTTALSYNKMNRTGSENLLFTYGLSIDKYF